MMAAGDGLVSMAPTSIAYSGTSAGINADGGVDFTAVTSLSLNGVFTSDYDNYLIVQNGVANTGVNFSLRLRASGSDNSTASSYTVQRLDVNGTGIQSSRASLNYTNFAQVYSTNGNGTITHVYGPFLAQPTALRTVNESSESGAAIYDLAITHNQSTSYDGFTIYTSGATVTGNIHVFGYEE
jgi:hypothetical protein